MISHNVEPIGHRTPHKRIDFRPIWPGPINTGLAAPYLDKVEADRIWQITKQVAEGTNPPEGK